MAHSLRVTPKPLGPGYRGRRARRQAFYSRQKTARLLRRVAASHWSEFAPILDQAYRDMLITGVGMVKLSQTFYDRSGAEVPPPDGSPRDGSIASMLSVRHVSREEFENRFY